MSSSSWVFLLRCLMGWPSQPVPCVPVFPSQIPISVSKTRIWVLCASSLAHPPLCTHGIRWRKRFGCCCPGVLTSESVRAGFDGLGFVLLRGCVFLILFASDDSDWMTDIVNGPCWLLDNTLSLWILLTLFWGTVVSGGNDLFWFFSGLAFFFLFFFVSFLSSFLPSFLSFLSIAPAACGSSWARD